MRREEAEAIWEAGREAVVEALLELSGGFAELSEKIAEQAGQLEGLSRQVDELDRQAGRDSSNSSVAPSSDLPKSRAERRRLAREAYNSALLDWGGGW